MSFAANGCNLVGLMRLVFEPDYKADIAASSLRDGVHLGTFPSVCNWQQAGRFG